jgi:hypothetical protein
MMTNTKTTTMTNTKTKRKTKMNPNTNPNTNLSNCNPSMCLSIESAENTKKEKFVTKMDEGVRARRED